MIKKRITMHNDVLSSSNEDVLAAIMCRQIIVIKEGFVRKMSPNYDRNEDCFIITAFLAIITPRVTIFIVPYLAYFMASQIKGWQNLDTMEAEVGCKSLVAMAKVGFDANRGVEYWLRQYGFWEGQTIERRGICDSKDPDNGKCNSLEL
jgi:hypothetical protein